MTGSEYAELMESSPEKAHRAVFDEYCNYVYAIVFNKLRTSASREDIEECVSDIFAEVYNGYDENRSGAGEMKGYIGLIAGRRATDMYRRLNVHRKHFFLSDDSDEEFVSDDDIEENTDKKHLREEMLRRIKELGEPDSTIIIMKFYYNRNSVEIGKYLSMTAISVRKRCQRAIKKLRGSISNMYEGGDISEKNR